MGEPEVPDYYEILGMGPQATVGEIKQAFRRLAKLHHPDKQVPGKYTDAEEFCKACSSFIAHISISGNSKANIIRIVGSRSPRNPLR